MRRYGRNQKRAHRAQVEQLKQSAQMQIALLGSMRGQLNQYEATIDDVVRVLGRHFFGLPAVRQEVDRVRESHRMTAADSAMAFTRMDPRIKPELVRYAVNELEVIMCTADLDRLRDTVHVMLHGRDGKLGYAISRSAMAQARGQGLAPYITEMIGREMADRFADLGRKA